MAIETTTRPANQLDVGPSAYVGLAQAFNTDRLTNFLIEDKRRDEAEAEKKKKEAQERKKLANAKIQELSTLELGETRQIDYEGVAGVYKDFLDYTTDNIYELLDTANFPDKWAEYQKMKADLTQAAYASMQMSEKKAELTEKLGSDEYLNMANLNAGIIDQISNTPIIKDGKINQEAIDLMAEELVPGKDFAELMQERAKGLESQGEDQLSFISRAGNDIMIIQEGEINEDNLRAYARDILSSTEGNFAINSYFNERSEPFNDLPEKKQNELLDKAVNDLKLFIKRDNTYLNLGDDNDYGGVGDVKGVDDLDFTDYLLGSSMAAGVTAVGSNVSVPLSNGGYAIYTRAVKPDGGGNEIEYYLPFGYVDNNNEYHAKNVDRNLLPEYFKSEIATSSSGGIKNTLDSIIVDRNKRSTSDYKIDENALVAKYNQKDKNIKTLEDVLEYQIGKDGFAGLISERDDYEIYDMSQANIDVVNASGDVTSNVKPDAIKKHMTDAMRNAADKGSSSRISINIANDNIVLNFEKMAGENAYEVKDSSGRILLDKDQTQGKSIEEISNLLYEQQIKSEVRKRNITTTRSKFNIGIFNAGAAGGADTGDDGTLN